MGFWRKIKVNKWQQRFQTMQIIGASSGEDATSSSSCQAHRYLTNADGVGGEGGGLGLWPKPWRYLRFIKLKLHHHSRRRYNFLPLTDKGTHLSGLRHCSKHITHLSSFNSHNNTTQTIHCLLFSLFYPCGNCNTGRSNNLPKVT